MLGRLFGTLVLALMQATLFLLVAFAVRRALRRRRARGRRRDRARRASRRSAWAAISAAIALRTGSLSLLQSLFPFMFVMLFTAPAFFPQNLLTPVLHDVSVYNPLTYVVEGIRGLLGGDASLGSPWAGFAAACGLARRHDRPRDVRAEGAPAAAMSVALVLWRRSLNEVLRVRGALLPATIAPVIFMLGITGQFGRLTGLDGFPTDSYISWIVPLSCLQGAGFAGAATGANLARDIEQGWFDRLLVAPVPRPLLVVGPILGAVTRSLVPATVVLVVGLAIGADLTGGVPGLLALYFACAGVLRDRRAVGHLHGRHVPHAAGRPADAAGRVPRGVPLDRLHAARAAARLAVGRRAPEPGHARARAGAPGDGRGDRAELRAHVPGVVALAGLATVLGALAVFGLNRMGR